MMDCSLCSKEITVEEAVEQYDEVYCRKCIEADEEMDALLTRVLSGDRSGNNAKAAATLRRL
jgi:hypothetical protein